MTMIELDEVEQYLIKQVDTMWSQSIRIPWKQWIRARFTELRAREGAKLSAQGPSNPPENG